MRLKLTCKETARLVLEGEDRVLPLGERALVRIHLGYCKGCTRFSKQVHLMRSAMHDWRRYADGSEEHVPPHPPGR
ncbi:zf-HC2 domain-containing protein [Sphaerotilus sp.]|uniref:anti-sigma factor family protein n=1 Tax=Sphaerotilus sp. TaxID=2093942 RepID=UPI0034E2CAA9